jgi:hypothetical protein
MLTYIRYALATCCFAASLGRLALWGSYSAYVRGMIFPLWYPALVFALADVGILRVRRHFSIRSALIAVSVVAVLLGMVVAL